MIDNSTRLRLIFGFKLRYLRLEKGKSYAELAKETGLSTSYLNDIEKGKKYPKPEKVELIAKSFGISYDEMVSTKSDKKIQPIIDFISSDFFKLFPNEKFGISIEKVLDVFTNTPSKTNAFINTILKMVRSYQIGQEDFYRVALRSYQDINNNYFPEIEEKASQFLKSNKLSRNALEDQLAKLNIEINYEQLAKNPTLSSTRSYFDTSSNTLFINSNLTEPQILFQLLKEIGFHWMGLTERPYETVLNRGVSFEKLLANFQASYFAISCLIPEEKLIEEIKKIALRTDWKPDLFRNLLDKFKTSPEMLLQRMTNILPHAFNAHDLFFIKLQQDQKMQYQMTKELHLSRIHNPYSNRLNEHFCQRWVSVTAIEQLKDGVVVDGQISEYVEHENRYLCITMAKPGNNIDQKAMSVTIGMLITPELRASFNFLKDEKLRRRTVHTTCERCPLTNCQERAAAPVVIQARERDSEISEALKQLGS